MHETKHNFHSPLSTLIRHFAISVQFTLLTCPFTPTRGGGMFFVMIGHLREEQRTPDFRRLDIVLQDGNKHIGHHSHQDPHGEEHNK